MFSNYSSATAYIINQQINNTAVGDGFPLIANDLRSLHDFALNEMELPNSAFHPNLLGYPCYLVPFEVAAQFGRGKGVARLAAVSHQAQSMKQDLRMQLEEDPSLADVHSFITAHQAAASVRRLR